MKKGVLITILIVSMVLTLLVMQAYTQEPKYVGNNKCKMCHSKQFKPWQESGHAKAFDKLDAQAKANPQCNSCHITGSTDLQGVQCEACHGPGSEYSKSLTIHKDKAKAKAAGQIDKPGEESCKKCHNDKVPVQYAKPFNFKERVARIAHPK